MADPFVEAFRDDSAPHYPNIEPGVPPANEPVRVGGRWWGCKDWLIRGEVPSSLGEVREVAAGAVPQLDSAQQHGAQAREADLAVAARWGVFHNEGLCAYVPIGAAPGFALNPLYLTYVGAAAEVEEWRWLPDDRLLNRGKRVHRAGLVVGLRNRIAVAVISPCFWEEP
jgi:hypothetical protein